MMVVPPPPSAPPRPAQEQQQDDHEAKRTRAASHPPQEEQEQQQQPVVPPPPPPPATTPDATPDAATRQPPPPPLIFDLLFFTGSLDAVTLTALACCSRDLRRAVRDFWEGLRTGNAVTKLKSVVVAAAASKKRPLPPPPVQPYGPVSKASLCIACHETTTRFLHPVHGQPLCPRCGRAAETAHCWSPLYEHRMMDEQEAKKRYCLDAAAPDALAERLRFAVRRATTTVTYATSGGGPDVRTVSYTKYAPHYAADAKEALFSFPRPVGGEGGSGDNEAGGGETRRVFLRREVAALMLELYGGPQLLQERIRHLGLEPLRVADVPN